MEPSAEARLLAVLGDPVAHSLSPRMHNAAIRALGLDAVYVALRTPVPALETVMAALAAVGAAGNVTVPHKEAAERYVTRKTDLCIRTGACNTFWTEQGTLVGDNTDVPGLLSALSALGVNGGRWLVVGTGGAARAVAVAAAHAGADLAVRSRSPERARRFAEWAETRGARTDRADGPACADVVLNATPLGLNPEDPMPLPPADVARAAVAFDLVYCRGGTAWVRALRAAGIPAYDGRELLVRQGAEAFTRFFPNQTPPLEVMRAAVAAALRA